MLTLKGRFVFGSAERANPFPGSLLFEPAGSPLQIIVVCRSDSPATTATEVELKGRFLDSTLRGVKVFEASSVEILQESTPVPHFTPDESEVSERIQGTVTFLSQCFKLKTGPTVFVTLEIDIQGGKQEVRLLLLHDAVQCAQYLCVGDQIEANNVTRFRWKTSSSSVDTTLSQASYRMSSTQEEGPNSQLRCYYVDRPECVVVLQHGVRVHPAHNANITTSTTGSANSSINATSANTTNHTTYTTTNTNTTNTNTNTTNTSINTITIDPQSFTNPVSLLDKEVYASTELSSVMGSVRNVHPSGWVELVDVTICYSVGDIGGVGGGNGGGGSGGGGGGGGGGSGSVNSSASMDIYNVDSYSDSQHSTNVNANTNSSANNNSTTYTIHIPHIILYISHYTVQHLRMTALGVSVRKTATICVLNTIPIYMYGRLKGITTTCRSNIEIVQFAQSSAFVSKDPLYCSINVNICSEYKNCCVLYMVRREEVRRKLAQCVSADFHSVCGVLCDSVVLYVESLATFGGVIGANGGVGSSGGGTSSTGTSVIGSCGNESGSATTTANTTLSTLTTMRTLLQLSPIAVQDEIYDLNTVLLHTIRNGYDSDYITNNMPQLYSVGSIISKLKSIHVHNEGYCHTNVYGVYVYDMCSVQLNNHYWSQYGGNKVSNVRKSIVLVGSVVHVSIPNLHTIQSISSGGRGSVWSANVTIVDAGGGSVVVIVSNVDNVYAEYLHTLCTIHMCKVNNDSSSVCSTCHRYKTNTTINTSQGSTNSTSGIHTNTEYCALCTCTTSQRPPLHTTSTNTSTNSNTTTHTTTNTTSNPLLLTVHFPQGLVEKQPQLHNTNTPPGELYRYFMTCDVNSVKFMYTDASGSTGSTSSTSSVGMTNAAPFTTTTTTTTPTTPTITTTTITGTTTTTHTTTPISIRTLLTMNLAHYKHKYIPALHCVVVNKQILSVEYKNSAHNQHSTTNSTTDTYTNTNGDGSTSYDIITHRNTIANSTTINNTTTNTTNTHYNTSNHTSNHTYYNNITHLTTQESQIKPKKRRLETQYSVCEDMDYGERLNKTDVNGSSGSGGSGGDAGVGGIYDSNMMYEQHVSFNATHATVTYTAPYEHNITITNTNTTNTTNTTNNTHNNTTYTNTNTNPNSNINSTTTTNHTYNTHTTNTNTTNNTTNTTNKKCCLTIRDTHYPDTINLYIPLHLTDNVVVGSVCIVTDLFACIPESKKKMYLKVAEGHRTRIDVLGLVQGAQLHTLCDHSRTIPDPRYIDTMYTTVCSGGSSAIGNNSASSSGSGTGNSSSGSSSGSGVKHGNMGSTTYLRYKHNNALPYTMQRIYEHYLQPPPPITIATLTPQCLYNRAVYTVTGQVTYIRKLHVTLRCTNCNSGVKKTTRLGGYMCTKCTSIYTIKPLWEVYIAFDDGTGECNMHIEGEQVYPLIRARYDSSGTVLSQVRRLVDNYVNKYGSLMYDAFDHSVSEYNKPYSEVVGERRGVVVDLTNSTSNSTTTTPNTNTTSNTTIITITNTSTANTTSKGNPNNAINTTTTTPIQYNTRSNLIFDIPLSEHTKRLVSHIDLTNNNTNTKVPLILRSYIQLVSYSTQYSVYCRVDYNTNTINATTIPTTNTATTTTNTTTTTTSTTNTTTTTTATKAKREVKLQRNNADKPYLAYFVSRPTHNGAKLSVQGLYARELHGEGLNSVSWELLRKLQLGK